MLIIGQHAALLSIAINIILLVALCAQTFLRAIERRALIDRVPPPTPSNPRSIKKQAKAKIKELKEEAEEYEKTLSDTTEMMRIV